MNWRSNKPMQETHFPLRRNSKYDNDTQRYKKIFYGLSNLHLVLSKKVNKESFNSNLTNEIAGLNSHSHCGAASFN